MSDTPAMRPTDAGPSFSLSNRLARLAWGITWLVLARFSPPFMAGWRRLVLILFGAKIGKNARIYSSAKIWLPSNLTVGEGAIIGPGAIIYNQGRISIGAHSVVSQRAHLCAGTHDIASSSFTLVCRPVVLGSGCWVAAEAFVAPGVTLGDGAILGARGALFEDAEPMAIYRGNPAKMIGLRKREQTQG
jgi:putative colanic acid biosynthesis acetyltransferase WcaF